MAHSLTIVPILIMKIFALKLLGAISLSLGVLGAFLPLLPSTCFILLAAWAFNQSSPRFHSWLVRRSPFSQSIYYWQQHRVIPTRVKWFATLSILTSFALTAWIVPNPVVITVLGAGMVLLLAYLLTRDSEVNSVQSVMQMHNHE